jgi:hypothetical protein
MRLLLGEATTAQPDDHTIDRARASSLADGATTTPCRRASAKWRLQRALSYDLVRHSSRCAPCSRAPNARRPRTMAKGEEKKGTNNKAKLTVKEKKAKKKEKLTKKG